MIFLQLFWTFFTVGALSFGGGYGMIALIRNEVLAHGWLTDEDFLGFVAVAESTPGPIAVNTATFVGSSQAGFFGAVCATLGVVLPSFLILLCIAALIGNFLRYAGVRAVLSGLRPAVIGLIFATALVSFFGTILSVKRIGEKPAADFYGILLFLLLCAITIVWRKIKKKMPSPLVLILFSAIYGIICYSV